MDDGVRMLLAVISYTELRTIDSNVGAISAATEMVGRRFWSITYGCGPDGCEIDGGVIPPRFKWIMQFSSSLMSNAISLHTSLMNDFPDPQFAKTLAEMSIDNPDNSWKTEDWNRPWDWFNTQTPDEQNYFIAHYKCDEDTSIDGVYWRIASGRPIDDWILLTANQQAIHCRDTGNICGATLSD